MHLTQELCAYPSTEKLQHALDAVQKPYFGALGDKFRQGTAAATSLHGGLNHLDELEAGKYFMLSSSVASGRPMSSSNLAMHTSHDAEQTLQCLMVSSNGVPIPIPETCKHVGSNTTDCNCQDPREASGRNV